MLESVIIVAVIVGRNALQVAASVDVLIITYDASIADAP
jgi:hypothetical protein